MYRSDSEAGSASEAGLTTTSPARKIDPYSEGWKDAGASAVRSALPSLHRSGPRPVASDAVRLPAMWCPLELRTYPGDRQVQERSEEFFRASGFDDLSMQSTKAMGTGRLACMWAPDGTDEGVQLLSDWLMWALLFDDRYCDSGALSRDPTAFNHLVTNMFDLSASAERKRLGDTDFDRFAATFVDIFMRIERIGGAEQVAFLRGAHFQWALGAACGVGDRNGHYLRGLDEHMIVRPLDGAHAAAIHLIEVAAGTWLNAVTRHRGPVRAVTAAAGVLLTVPTDIASYAHEQRQKSLESNIVAILAADHGCPAQEAVDMAYALLEEIMQMFVELTEQLMIDAEPALAHYLRNLSNMVRGTLEWQRLLPRYAYPPEQFADLASGDYAAEALHEIATERLFPPVEPPSSIRWWWDYLRPRSIRT